MNTDESGACGARSGHDRREFGKVALAGALGAAGLLGPAGKAPAETSRARTGIKLCAQAPAEPTDDQLLFLRQIGAAYVSVAAPPGLRTADGFLRIKKRYADAGIAVWNIGNSDVHNMPEVTLNLPGRDAKIDQYTQYLRDLGKASAGRRDGGSVSKELCAPVQRRFLPGMARSVVIRIRYPSIRPLLLADEDDQAEGPRCPGVSRSGLRNYRDGRDRRGDRRAEHEARIRDRVGRLGGMQGDQGALSRGRARREPELGAAYPTDARPDHQSSGGRRRRLTRCARPASVVRGGNEAGIVQPQG